MQGFQKPASQPSKPVGLARITYDEDNGRAYCSCGWSYYHLREKVREDAIDRHFARKHNDRGIRL